MQISVLNALSESVASYEPKPYDGPGVLFLASGADGSTIDHANLARWQTLVSGGLEVHIMPGTHASIMEEPTLSQMATRMRELLGAG